MDALLGDRRSSCACLSPMASAWATSLTRCAWPQLYNAAPPNSLSATFWTQVSHGASTPRPQPLNPLRLVSVGQVLRMLLGKTCAPVPMQELRPERQQQENVEKGGVG